MTGGRTSASIVMGLVPGIGCRPGRGSSMVRKAKPRCHRSWRPAIVVSTAVVDSSLTGENSVYTGR